MRSSSSRPVRPAAGSARTRGRGAISGIASLVALCLHVAWPPAASPEIFSWRNPAIYGDASPIPADVRATIETRLYVSRDRAAWSRFATVPGGAETWSGALPLPPGASGYYAVTATIPADGLESPFSVIVAYPPGPDPGGAAVSGPPDEYSVILGTFEDTYVAVGDTASRAAEPVVRTYIWPAGAVANRGFLKWDLSSIPPEAEVTSAALRLYCVSGEGVAGDNVLAVSVGKVVGAPPDLTGGRLAQVESTVRVGKRPGWIVWNVTGMVRDWVRFPGANYGMALEPDRAATADSNRSFASRDHPDPLLRPELMVSYRLPARAPAVPGAAPPPPASPSAGPDASADTVTVSVGGLEDTYVNSGGYADVNYASEPVIATYTWPANAIANRGFLRWDLSGVPGDAVIDHAALWLYLAAAGAAGDDAYAVRVARVDGGPWDFGRVTWNASDGFSPWPGGRDGGAAAVGAAASAVAVGRTPRWVSWDVTDLVRGWVARPETNFGMAVEGDASAGVDTGRFFASSEFPDPLLRPRLLITYTPAR